MGPNYSELKFRPSAACRIAGLERTKMNEYIANGDYPCPPITIPGRARIFTEIDLIGLWFFARLIERHGYTVNRAGWLTGRVMEKLSTCPDEKEIVVHISAGGLVHTIEGSRHDPEAKSLGGESPILLSHKVHIDNIRKLVRREIDDEINTLGEED